MALPASGPLSLSDIQAEFGGTNPISISEYYKGGAFVLTTDFAPNVPTSGTINISDFYGARKTTLTTLTFTTAGDNLFVMPSTVVGNLQIVTMTGGGGGGGGPDSQPGASGYGGLIITGGNVPVSAGDIVNCFVGGGGGPGGTGGGGGGGKIICTKLHELGLMSTDIYLADQDFGAELLRTRPDIYNMMPWMSDEQFGHAAQRWSTSWAKDIATPWAEHMAYKMGVVEKDNVTGRMITLVGIPICKAVGVWQRLFGASDKPAGFVKGAMLVPVFVAFKIVACVGRLLENKND
jgi:hypothetical protein